MTNPQTAQMLNRQIETELRKLNSILTDEDDKPAIMNRIKELKAMIDGSEEVTCEPELPTFKEIAVEAIRALRDRRQPPK